MKHHPEKSARLVVAAVAVAGTISGLVLTRTFLQALGAPPVLFLATLPVGYIGLSWSVRGYFASLSPNKTAGLMVTSAGLLGALMGTSLSTIVAIAFLLALTILDVLAVEFEALPALVGSTSYDQVVSVSTLQLEKYVVGLGDLLAYSILTTAVLRVLGIYGAIATLVLIFSGIGATFKLTKRRGRAPGLLIPVCLGLVPLVLGLFIV
jgi:hypothetical protein